MASTPARTALRRVLQGTAALGAITLASQAYAQDGRPTGVENTPGIVIRNDLNPNTLPPTGVLDPVDITGVGQFTVDEGGGFVGLCTGTLINPRTVILAAHCVNSAPAASYGKATGGTGASVGFKMNNLPALQQWLGAGNYATNTANALYNVEQVWYDPRSTTPSANSFLEGDVALATLDTPATGIPTWTMLFSPLTEETHATITGYGNRGTSATGEAGIDFRRRVAENMLSVLGSLDDRDDWLFGPAPATNPQSLYMLDFDSPAGQAAYNSAAGRYDFDVFDGAALPREGTTGGGDSGGPLVVDQAFSKPVVAGVLSGGSRFFTNQKFSTYGTHSFYQPLFLFWDAIVANNSYVYASAKAGAADWDDASHWIQDMDPNYGITVNGQLVNGLPDTPALGVSGNTPKFGSICFLDDCTDLADDDEATPVPTGNGTPIYVAGGPGTTNFVPNNVVANPSTGVKARYYDVTLAAAGLTSLGSSRTIDRLTVSGSHILDIRNTGELNVLTDFTQWSGWTNISGLLRSREALIATGTLSGTGTIDPTYLTIGAATVSPAGQGSGTFTVKGDLILSSGATLAIDLGQSQWDRLVVQGDAQNTGIAALGGTVAFNRGMLSTAPRDGQSFVFLTATGGVNGTFATVTATSLGVLQPQLTYAANSVTVKLKAGSLAALMGKSSGAAGVFANALDTLRAKNYTDLYNLYGSVDLMAPAQLASTLHGLNPTIMGESRALQQRQSTVMLNAVTDRLSMLGTGQTAGQLSIVGTPDALTGLTSMDRGETAARSSTVRALLPNTTSIGKLPERVSGFISGGFANGGAGYGVRGQTNGQQSWYVGMGLEMEVADYTTLGTSVGFSEGSSRPGGGDEADSRVSQITVYGSHRLGGGAYLAGLGMAEQTRTGLRREASTGDMAYRLAGSANISRYAARAEAGVNLPVADALNVTPRVSLGYSSFAYTPFREGGGELALQVDRMSAATFEGRAGVQFGGSAKMGSWTLVPQLTADYVRTLAGDRGSMLVRFASAPDAAMLLPLMNGDAAWGEVRGGVRLANGPVEFGAGIERRIGRTLYRDDRAVVDARLRF